MFRRPALCALVVMVALLSFLSTTHAQVPFVPGQTVEQSIEVAGIERTYRAHLPSSVESANGLPVLIVLHGGGGNAKQFERSSGFSGFADEEGFLAVYPDGSSRRLGLQTWNAYSCCGYAYAAGIDDVGFISVLIDHLVSDEQVDPTRIYVTGFSNGAMMTFRIACELSDKVAAAAPYAGALNTDSCSPATPVPMLIMNGDADENVPVAGGTSPNAGVASQDDRVDRPTAHAVDTWVAANGCVGTPMVEDTTVALTNSWTDCSAGSKVEQILIHGWTHKWPSVENGAPFDATSVIWEFVSQFSKSQYS